NCSGTGCANGATGVRALDVDPSATHLIAIGNFNSVTDPNAVGGSTTYARDQVALLDLGSTTGVVDPNWNTGAYTAACFSWAFDTYMRGVQFSPDGKYFVITATGGSGTNTDGTNSSCDTAARFDLSTTGQNVRPTWLNYTGQDTLWSVAITGTVVYVGGHQRWLNNSQGFDYAGPGAVPRPGIAALSPTSGVPLSWNPGRDPRGAAAYTVYATSTGLWVGSDTDYIGPHKYLHKKLAFFPLAGGETLPSNATGSLPGRVYEAGAFNSGNNTPILYRVNAGGPTVGAIDNGPDWVGDSDPSAYHNDGSNTAGWSPVSAVDSTVPATTPSAIFDSERWDPGSNNDGGEMHWAFAVPAGETVAVRLYLANRCSCTSGVGQRVFDVAVNGTTFLNHYDIVQTAGDQTGHMESTTVTSDGEVTVDFTHETENPLINGIEIVKTADVSAFPVSRYRVDSGGPKIAALSSTGPANWQEDDNNGEVGTGTPFRTSDGNPAFWGTPWGGTADSNVPASTPLDIFGSELWDSGPPDVQYRFPMAPGTPVDVRLFFANNCGCTSSPGSRQFNVFVNGTQVLTNYDPVTAAGGDQRGDMQKVSTTVPASGVVTVSFTHGAGDNPLINGVELVQTGATPPPPPSTNVDRFAYRQTSSNGDGTVTSGSEQSMSTGIAWGSVRGAFAVNGELIYGKGDGNLYERTFDGTTFGPEVLIDPYNDPIWDNIQTGSGQTYQGARSTLASELSSVSAMFFSGGRIYYTQVGQTQMHWRWFEPESGIVGSDEFTVNDGHDWSNVGGAFLSGSTLYYGDRNTGQLDSIGFTNGTPTGTPIVADSHTGWPSRGLFLLPNATPNKPPVPAFTPNCSATSNSCTFDASSSNDPDGSITDFGWNFGDGSSEHHPDSSLITHTFPAPGHYTVTLTVTDNDGTAASKATSVTVGTTSSPPAYKASSQACGTATNTKCGTATVTDVTVPAATAKGDALLMFVTWADNTTTATPPAGWKKLGSNVNAPLESDVYYKSAAASDAGSIAEVAFGKAVKNNVTIADYGSADGTAIEASAFRTDSSTASHTTPNATVSVDGSLALSFWSDKSSTTTAWTAPAGVTARSSSYDTGGGFVTTLLADSGSTVNSGTYGSKTATTNAASGKGAMWTIILAPAGPAGNAAPTAAFTSSCPSLSCSFDGSGSSDDGSITNYHWNFGDGNSADTAGPTTSHNYSAAGPFTVTLTVTDNGTPPLTGQVSHQVNPGTTKQISWVGESHYDNNATSGSVTVPAATTSGDTLLLFVSFASTSVTTSTPAGWTQVATKAGSNLSTIVYAKTAGASDAGTTVTSTFSGTVKASMILSAYHNAQLPVEAQASSAATSTATHVTPTVNGLLAGSWAISYWTDKSTTTTGWTLPGDVTSRAQVTGTGSGADAAALADAGPVSGSYGGKTATTNATSGSAVQWTVALQPAP
ncbi:MAG: PKD domain-containing protein, partial [Frankiales bacterium]|nr:PKD domain-containing protein [Frankiales bacterium]